MEKVLTQLNAQAKKLDEEQAELTYRLKEARKLEDDLRREKDKVTSKRQDIIDASRRDAVDLKRSLRVEAEKIIRELKAQTKESLSDREAAKAIEQARRAIQQISLPEAEKPHRDPIDRSQLKVGQQVFVNTLGSIGTVEDMGSKQLTVSLRGMTSASSSVTSAPLILTN